MQINRLIIKGLYGYIDKNIDFNSDLTLLVGINGSGKTSVLNILNWVLKPSIPNLCVTEFASIQLFFTFENTAYKILCEHTEFALTYKISTDKKEYNPLVVKISIPPFHIKNDTQIEKELLEEYLTLTPEKKEKETWNLISTFPTPTILGLDRNTSPQYTEKSEFSIGITANERYRREMKKIDDNQNLSPLDKVKEIVNTEYRKSKNLILSLTRDLKNDLMLATFHADITLKSVSSGIKNKLILEEIENVEKKVNEYFVTNQQNILTKKEKSTITTYFEQLKKITESYQADPKNETTKILYGLNANRFTKINKLLKEFERFELKSNEIFEQINTFIDALNFFFKDSAKQLLFKEDTAELMFHTLDKEGKIIKDYKDIKFLSSGEQQILILFSYIAFNSQDGRIFIIDEPELSLHVKWQEEFLAQLERVTPKFTQIILATHSPILANKKKEKAKVLLPYNN